MTNIEKDIQQVLRITEKLAVAQSNTTKNVDRLTSDVDRLVGNTTEIALMKKDIKNLQASEETRKKIFVSVSSFLAIAAIGILFGIKG